MSVNVHVRCETSIRPVTKADIISLVKFVAAKEIVKPPWSVNVSFVATDEIRFYNRKYFKRSSSTDVISFPLMEKTGPRSGAAICLGDILICVDEAKRNGTIHGLGFKRELKLYTIHGLLHLLGYEDTSSSKRRVMEQRQMYFLNLLEGE